MRQHALLIALITAFAVPIAAQAPPAWKVRVDGSRARPLPTPSRISSSRRPERASTSPAARARSFGIQRTRRRVPTV